MVERLKVLVTRSNNMVLVLNTVGNLMNQTIWQFVQCLYSLLVTLVSLNIKAS